MSRTILSIVRKKIRVHVTSLLIYTTIFTPLVVLELLSSFRTSTRTKFFRTLVPELVLGLKLWNFSSRTSTRTKIFGSVVPELVLELKIVGTLFQELVLELKFWNCSSRTSTRTKIFGTHSSRTSTGTKLNYGTTTTLFSSHPKIKILLIYDIKNNMLTTLRKTVVIF